MAEMLNPDIGMKYQAAETNYEAGEAEFDASEFNYQVVDLSGDIVCMCSAKEDRDHILKLLQDNPIPE